MKKLVGIQEVAIALGLKPASVYNMVSRRQIPFTKVGRLTKFDPDAIDAWIAKQTYQPLSPVRRFQECEGGRFKH